MIVGFDTWILSSRYRFSGYYVYAKTLLSELGQLAQEDDSIKICPFVLRGHANDANDLISSPGISASETTLLGIKPPFWWGAGAQLASRKIRADIHFSPTLRILPIGLVPTVTMIADTTPLKLPELLLRRGFSDRVFLNLSSRLSKRIITISECSKRDIVEAYGIKPENVSVTYLSYDRATFNREPVVVDDQNKLFRRLGIKKPYILHHGSLHIRKNLVRLIQSYSMLMERHPDWDLQLVLVGALAWRHEEIIEAAKKAKHGQVIITGALPDDQLSLVVKGASVSVVPSLYEGFCLPMIEAMACGIPTITSNNSCLPEVSGNVLRYFDPLSLEDIAFRIEQALCDTDVRQELATVGPRRAAEFTWTKCARESLATLVGTYQEITGREVRLPKSSLADAASVQNQVAKG